MIGAMTNIPVIGVLSPSKLFLWRGKPRVRSSDNRFQIALAGKHITTHIVAATMDKDELRLYGAMPTDLILSLAHPVTILRKVVDL
jgi:hypothetical protein